MAEKLQIGVIFPEVLGTYGDGGNAIILRKRAELRGYDAEIITLDLGTEIPDSLDIYTLGGGEDSAQALAAQQLLEDRGFKRAMDKGTPLLAICAGMQVLGQWYTDANNRKVAGVGILDCTTVPQGKRSIGELVSEPLLEGLTDTLTGFENHGGATLLGSDALPLGKVIVGSGNGAEPGSESSGVEGVVQGSVIATYMHGPALARNPQLADYLLAKAIGISTDDMTPINWEEIDALRKERLDFSLSNRK